MEEVGRLREDQGKPIGRWLRVGVVLALLAGIGLAYRLSVVSADREATDPQRVVLVEEQELIEPPEPEVQEIEVPETELLDDAEDIEEVSAIDDALGLDADGSAGTDMFGLRAKKGGRDLLEGADAAWALARSAEFRQYAQRLAITVRNALNRREELRRSSYAVAVKLWVDERGRVERHAMAGSTGRPAIDELLDRELATLPVVDGRLPAGLPQPITLRIVVRSGGRT